MYVLPCGAPCVNLGLQYPQTHRLHTYRVHRHLLGCTGLGTGPAQQQNVHTYINPYRFRCMCCVHERQITCKTHCLGLGDAYVYVDNDYTHHTPLATPTTPSPLPANQIFHLHLNQTRTPGLPHLAPTQSHRDRNTTEHTHTKHH